MCAQIEWNGKREHGALSRLPCTTILHLAKCLPYLGANVLGKSTWGDIKNGNIINIWWLKALWFCIYGIICVRVHVFVCSIALVYMACCRCQLFNCGFASTPYRHRLCSRLFNDYYGISSASIIIETFIFSYISSQLPLFRILYAGKSQSLFRCQCHSPCCVCSVNIFIALLSHLFYSRCTPKHSYGILCWFCDFSRRW